MAYKLILNKGTKERVREFADVEEAFNAAEPWVRKGFTARITDKQGSVKYTQTLANGEVTTYRGDATARTPRTGGEAWHPVGRVSGLTARRFEMLTVAPLARQTRLFDAAAVAVASYGEGALGFALVNVVGAVAEPGRDGCLLISAARKADLKAGGRGPGWLDTYLVLAIEHGHHRLFRRCYQITLYSQLPDSFVEGLAGLCNSLTVVPWAAARTESLPKRLSRAFPNTPVTCPVTCPPGRPRMKIESGTALFTFDLA